MVVPVRNEAGNIAPLVDEIAAALGARARFEIIYVNDGSTDGTEAELRRLDGEPALAAPDQACGVVRPIGGGAHRRRACARPGRRDARRRRPERSGLHSRAARGARSRRAAHRARRRPARRAQGYRLQEIPVAHRQRRARRGAARRHPRHRLRAEGVSPRRVPGAALFRRAAPLPAGAGPARGLRDRLCRRGRPAAPAPASRITACGTGSGSASSISPACGGSSAASGACRRFRRFDDAH